MIVELEGGEGAWGGNSYPSGSYCRRVSARVFKACSVMLFMGIVAVAVVIVMSIIITTPAMKVACRCGVGTI